MSISPATVEKINRIVHNYEGETLKQIAKKNGINVYAIDMDDFQGGSVSGAILKSNTGNYEIYINAKENQNRQRFTLAHELGHYFLHHDTLEDSDGIIDREEQYLLRGGNNYGDESGTRKAMEIEANAFAAELLMPEKVVKDAWRRTDDIKDLSEFFGVSLSAMAIRIENLRLNY